MRQTDHAKISHNGMAASRSIWIADVARFVSATALICITSPSYANGVSDTATRRSNPIAVINEKPIAKDDFVALKKASNAFNALTNDVDPNGDRLTLISASANFGAVAFTPEGLLAYAQDPGRPRADKITYTISDARGGFDQGVVEIALP